MNGGNNSKDAKRIISGMTLSEEHKQAEQIQNMVKKMVKGV